MIIEIQIDFNREANLSDSMSFTLNETSVEACVIIASYLESNILKNSDYRISLKLSFNNFHHTLSGRFSVINAQKILEFINESVDRFVSAHQLLSPVYSDEEFEINNRYKAILPEETENEYSAWPHIFYDECEYENKTNKNEGDNVLDETDSKD